MRHSRHLPEVRIPPIAENWFMQVESDKKKGLKLKTATSSK